MIKKVICGLTDNDNNCESPQLPGCEKDLFEFNYDHLPFGKQFVEHLLMDYQHLELH